METIEKLLQNRKDKLKEIQKAKEPYRFTSSNEILILTAYEKDLNFVISVLERVLE